MRLERSSTVVQSRSSSRTRKRPSYGDSFAETDKGAILLPRLSSTASGCGLRADHGLWSSRKQMKRRETKRQRQPKSGATSGDADSDGNYNGGSGGDDEGFVSRTPRTTRTPRTARTAIRLQQHQLPSSCSEEHTIVAAAENRDEQSSHIKPKSVFGCGEHKDPDDYGGGVVGRRDGAGRCFRADATGIDRVLIVI